MQIGMKKSGEIATEEDSLRHPIKDFLVFVSDEKKNLCDFFVDFLCVKMPRHCFSAFSLHLNRVTTLRESSLSSLRKSIMNFNEEKIIRANKAHRVVIKLNRFSPRIFSDIMYNILCPGMCFKFLGWKNGRRRHF